MTSYDIREAIIQQILISMGNVEGLVAIHRDRQSVPLEDPDTKVPLLPAGLFLDAKETPSEEDRGRQGQSRRGQMPQITVDMEPQIFIVLLPTMTVENTGIGEQLSAFRIKMFKALVTNVNLMSLLGMNGGITYLGFDTDMQQGSDARGQMRLDFRFSYVFDPSVI